jgi:hypothetical protein
MRFLRVLGVFAVQNLAFRTSTNLECRAILGAG